MVETPEPVPESSSSSTAGKKQPTEVRKQGNITFPIKIRVQQIKSSEWTIRTTSTDRLIEIFQMTIGRRTIVQMRKAQDAL